MKKFLVSILVIFIIIFTTFLIVYYNSIKCVGNDDSDIDFNVNSGSNFYSIASQLKEAGLIKSEFFYKIYIKLNKVSGIQSGVYVLNNKMSVKEIVNKLQGSGTNPDMITITFKEGYDMTDIIKEITKHTNNTEEDVLNILRDNDYLNSLIIKYWFIDESILNQDLYYPLEGYLYPNTYQFDNKDVSPDWIFNVMINQMDQQLKKYKRKIKKNKWSFHQLLTLASITELEGLNSNDRKGIAGVFYNRLNANMNLGSDVTAYYGARVKMSDRDLYKEELNSNNPYNTRSLSMVGKLPIGPICNPSIESIRAVLNPEHNDYYFFVSDKNGKTYFSKDALEHANIIQKLKNEGLWYEY